MKKRYKIIKKCFCTCRIQWCWCMFLHCDRACLWHIHSHQSGSLGHCNLNYNDNDSRHIFATNIFHSVHMGYQHNGLPLDSGCLQTQENTINFYWIISSMHIAIQHLLKCNTYIKGKGWSKRHFVSWVSSQKEKLRLCLPPVMVRT